MINKNSFRFFRKHLEEIIFICIASIFSLWLTFSTFSYSKGSMIIATKAWSDFAAHIPLIRSFSFGSNFPPQYPLFPDEPIRYHFLFHLLVGALERIGLRIDFALNLPSAIGFAFLLFMIFTFAKLLFKFKITAVLSVLFFLFNGSLSFLEFFKIHSFSKNTLSEIISNSIFSSFGPYDGKIVSAFWNLNIYTNQRHLALAYALSLLLIFLTLKPVFNDRKFNLRTSIFTGVLIGIFFYLHISVFILNIIVLSFLFLLFPKIRRGVFLSLIIGAFIAIPQYLYYQSGTKSIFQFLYAPGYLITGKITLLSFINYWFRNIGLHMILIPLGFIISPRNVKKVFAPFLIIFIIPNLFQFSVDMASNHKFFNYFMLIGSMFSAYFLNFLWRKNLITKLVFPVLLFFLIFSGIVDFFPIYNDTKMQLPDYPKNQSVIWIMKNTPKDSLFLNTNYLYDPASLAGRKIFLGWPYFSWSAGYDTYNRDLLRKKLFDTNDINLFCKSAKEYKIQYISIDNGNLEKDFKINFDFFNRNFLRLYDNKDQGIVIFSVKPSC